MPRRVSPADAIAEAQRVVAAAPGRTVLIGIDGYGGAGKTTFAARLAAALDRAVVVHIDDFAAPSVPEWDWDRFRAQVVLPLLAGRPGRYQRWDWASDSGAEWHDVPTGRPVVIEGVSSTRREVAAPWALTIWVDAPLAERLRRAVERDGPELLPTWREVWIPSEDAYVARENPLARVDLIIPGTLPLPSSGAG
jgi:uridine kinase